MTREFILPTGTLIKNYMEHNCLDEKNFYKRLNKNADEVAGILHGNKMMTEEIAIELEKIFNISREYWINYDNKFQIYLQGCESDLSMNLTDLKVISKKFKFDDVFEGLDWNIFRQAKEMLSILQLENFGQFEERYAELSVDFMEDGGDIEPMVVWLKLCQEEIEIQNEDISDISFSKEELRNHISMFKDISLNGNIDESLDGARQLCNMLGINLVILEAITNSKIRGALLNYEGKPTIFLSYRFRSYDHIWYALIHELAHLLLHYESREEIMISYEDEFSDKNISRKENEANEFARDFFINPTDYKKFVENNSFNKIDVERFAAQQGVLPGLVVGRLQHDKHISYSELSYLKIRD
ncbi:ImmA/IrrE family metallo-endopeptidase [Enterococcus gallinarum]|uniref:ImmA/IrrE family metallo-endopeptidase n=1 Tax=Enterococcus gallinarum TaxID=1353 RepID=UPI001D17A08B|nr:ImmA/IrrE family metallo-endopeptidase [Enterococcus gallinarum]MCC4044735.1 ImmA/IrrE family metallo-endopeptidase [Enterococcus gallinarum]